MKENWDVIVIGGGPAGYSAALRAGQLNLKTILIEKSDLGGTCLNQGCIPTKALVQFAQRVAEIKEARHHGIDLEFKGINLNQFHENKNNLIGKLRSGVKSILQAANIKLCFGEASFLTSDTIVVTDSNGKKEIIKGKNIIIATGSQPIALPHMPFDGKSIMSSNDVLQLEHVPKRLAIIGGGVIGLEFASIFASLGSSVHVIEKQDSILANEDEEMSRQLQSYLKERGISFKMKHLVSSCEILEQENILHLEKDGEKSLLIADVVIVAIGRTGNIKNLELEKAGVQVKQGLISTDGNYRTNVTSIYAIGDVTPGWQLAHTAYEEGFFVAEYIAGMTSAPVSTVVPRTIFTSPEFCAAGLTESEARRVYEQIDAYTFPLSINPKAMISGHNQGLIKLLVNRLYGEIVGITMIGHGVNELISEVSLAIELEATIHELSHVIHPHPSLSEGLKEVFLQAAGKPFHSKKSKKKEIII
ncbi:dihydrolipoyl dehydrogenase [Neobacillus sp.]|uniref:dihydrolipoyl dehydrogenase n=1 Tax=Neobacillus sp. TaxID=2675273 RepID=UPI00289AC33C|nr:dihydrolipoyl dehydrogenase [Neobacillus sp.]